MPDPTMLTKWDVVQGENVARRYIRQYDGVIIYEADLVHLVSDSMLNEALKVKRYLNDDGPSPEPEETKP